MKANGIFAILYFMILYVLHISDAKCDEYVIVFEEYSCGKIYLLKPMKLREINWDGLTYPYNSTDIYDEIHGYKECMLEFDCMGSELSCLDDIKPKNYATHSFIPGNNTMQRFTYNNEELDKPKINISESEKPKDIGNEGIDTSMYDVNLIYMNENDMQNSSEFFQKESRNQRHIVHCHYAETVCIKEKHSESHSSRNVTNKISTTHHNETAGTLIVTLTRDQNSTIQPIFTGYFPQLYNDSNNKNVVDPSFNELKTVTFTCKFLEGFNCKQNVMNETIKQINVYLKTNYIQNNTRTKYLNCTKDFSSTNNSLNLTCNAKEFANHNPHILYTPQPNNKTEIKSNSQAKEKTILIWNCQIMKINHTLPTKEHNDYNLIYLKNCSNNRNTSCKNRSGDNNSTLVIDNTERIIGNSTTNDVFGLNRAKISGRTTGINKDNSSSTDDENVITIHITESGNNCSLYSPFSFHEGKIIELETNKEKLLENDVLELKLFNCINIKSSIANNTQIHEQTELAIIVKNGSLNTSNLKLLKSTPKEAYIKERIVLQCDRPDGDLSIETAKNKTVLDCKFIDLDNFNNTAGSEHTTGLSNTSNTSNDEGKIKHNILTKVNPEINASSNCSSNKTVALNKCNITRNETTIKVVENKAIENDTLSKDKITRQNFNRKKDIEGSGQNSLALKDDKTEKIMLIVIASIAGTSLLIILALKKCTKKGEYTPAATREPPNEEETAF